MDNLQEFGKLVDLHVHPNYAFDVERARNDKETRKQVLRKYRMEVVRPVLLKYDQKVYMRAASKLLPAIGLPFSRFVPKVERIPLAPWHDDSIVESKRIFQLWAVVRCTGKWPLCVLGYWDCPIMLESCRSCGQRLVTICHGLCYCKGTLAMYRRLRGDSQGFPVNREDTPGFLTALFRNDIPEHRHAIQYVGMALLSCIGKQRPDVHRLHSSCGADDDVGGMLTASDSSALSE